MQNRTIHLAYRILASLPPQEVHELAHYLHHHNLAFFHDDRAAAWLDLVGHGLTPTIQQLDRPDFNWKVLCDLWKEIVRAKASGVKFDEPVVV